MSKWGNNLIKGLIQNYEEKLDLEENLTKQTTRKRDGTWQNDPDEYVKRKAKTEKWLKEQEGKPICESQLKFKPQENGDE